jgi:hypothetical protein
MTKKSQSAPIIAPCNEAERLLNEEVREKRASFALCRVFLP